MARPSKTAVNQSIWRTGALWCLGASAFLLQLTAGADYLLGGVSHHAGDFICVANILGGLAIRTFVHVCHESGGLQSMMRLLPLSAVPVLLMSMAAILERCGSPSRFKREDDGLYGQRGGN